MRGLMISVLAMATRISYRRIASNGLIVNKSAQIRDVYIWDGLSLIRVNQDYLVFPSLRCPGAAIRPASKSSRRARTCANLQALFAHVLPFALVAPRRTPKWRRDQAMMSGMR